MSPDKHLLPHARTPGSGLPPEAANASFARSRRPPRAAARFRRWLLPALILAAGPAGAADAVYGHELTEAMTVLTVQLGIIFFAARFAGALMKRLRLPTLIGELLAGILLGPYLLGSLPLPLLPAGLFPLVPGSVPISLELYGFASVAVIVMLFMTGLETDLPLFLKFSLRGGLIGLAGALVAFFGGAFAASVYTGDSLFAPQSLFIGVFSMTASVGIPARVLSERRKMDSPEGVTVIAAAVIQDVFAIVALAVIVSLISVLHLDDGTSPDWTGVLATVVQAFGVWIGFTALGLIFARRIGRFLKRFRNPMVFSVLALGLAFLMAGLFERAGLAMIVGAYVMGLSLSKTDIAFVIQDKLAPVQEFFVPIFFTVMGMLVDVRLLFSADVALFGLLLAVLSNGGKLIGSGGAALAMQFNRLGATRVAAGLFPRGEVSFIIAGIGLASAILSDNLFGIAIVMALISAVFGTPYFSWIVSRPAAGIRRALSGIESVRTPFEFGSEEITDLVAGSVLKAIENEGFFIYRMDLEDIVYQIRRENVSLSLTRFPTGLEFTSSRTDLGFINTLVYESLLALHESVDRLRSITKPGELRREFTPNDAGGRLPIARYLAPECVRLALRASTRDDAIRELVDLLYQAGRITDRQTVLDAVLEREHTVSTGMQDGLALPHAKSDATEAVVFAVGLKPEGIDFKAIDDQPSRIIILIVSPKHKPGPHLQLLAELGGMLRDAETRDALFACQTEHELVALFGLRMHRAK